LLRSLHADAKLEAWAKKLQSQADTFIVRSRTELKPTTSPTRGRPLTSSSEPK
jgi:hypothetical protein